jgi:hypothetical protein
MGNNIISGIIQSKIQKEINTKNGPALRTAYKINGEMYSTLDKKLANFSEGTNVNVGFSVSGDFKNIDWMKTAEETIITDNDSPNTSRDKVIPKKNWSEDNSRRIVRQNCLTQANEFLKLVKDKISEKSPDDQLEYLFEVARRCESWVFREE